MNNLKNEFTESLDDAEPLDPIEIGGEYDPFKEGIK